ncbi:hypothetical protein [Moraxella lacunata]|uniref:hypothetical protein n=1 Tax=Moraxella lacunata TaxID=477 RepID=UPI003EDFD9B6
MITVLAPPTPFLCFAFTVLRTLFGGLYVEYTCYYPSCKIAAKSWSMARHHHWFGLYSADDFA